MQFCEYGLSIGDNQSEKVKYTTTKDENMPNSMVDWVAFPDIENYPNSIG